MDFFRLPSKYSRAHAFLERATRLPEPVEVNRFIVVSPVFRVRERSPEPVEVARSTAPPISWDRLVRKEGSPQHYEAAHGPIFTNRAEGSRRPRLDDLTVGRLHEQLEEIRIEPAQRSGSGSSGKGLGYFHTYHKTSEPMWE
jgi:hypothetical protein